MTPSCVNIKNVDRLSGRKLGTVTEPPHTFLSQSLTQEVVMFELTYEKLHEHLSYSPTSGKWLRIKGVRGASLGSNPASYDKIHGYNHVCVGGKRYRSSRLAWFYMTGYWPEHQVDHDNRIKHDDRWSNLKHATVSCNGRNCGIKSNNTSGIRGIYFNKLRSKWCAQITVDMKAFNLGIFESFDEAVCTRLAAEQCLNWSDCDSSSPAYQYVKENITAKAA